MEHLFCLFCTYLFISYITHLYWDKATIRDAGVMLVLGACPEGI